MFFITKILLINTLFFAGFYWLLPDAVLAFIVLSIVLVISLCFTVFNFKRKHTRLVRALSDGLISLSDGDFAISLSTKPYKLDDQIKPSSKAEYELLQLFNQATDKLRIERQSLYQRELLLDKVVNSSGVVTVLVNHRQQVVFTNRAAGQFFGQSSIVGQHWLTLLKDSAPSLLEYEEKSNAIIQLVPPNQSTSHAVEQSWHYSRHGIRLHGAAHQLIMLKPITQEMHQQELQTWKKVIRVINHELNNSIAPISSMCHSGNILAEQLQHPQLNRVFDTISSRINKLADFIKNYSELARLSKPIKQPFDVIAVLKQIQKLYDVELLTEHTSLEINADESQIEQLLINLIKNAIEAGCGERKSTIFLQKNSSETIIKVRDFGAGMTDEIMQKAFLPYYSTKPNGSGIGLSICRDVTDAHNGQLNFYNHPDGGLEVSILIPN